MAGKRKKPKADSVTCHLPPVPPDLDLRDVPIPVDAFIELAMQQFGLDRETATSMVLESVAKRYGAKGVA
jgi:hypothetical protein